MTRTSAFRVSADGGKRNKAQPQIKAPAKTAATAAVGLWKARWESPPAMRTVTQAALVSKRRRLPTASLTSLALLLAFFGAVVRGFFLDHGYPLPVAPAMNPRPHDAAAGIPRLSSTESHE
ncbi:hypothetical protein M1D51_02710 [Arthrobacter sp. R3-55]